MPIQFHENMIPLNEDAILWRYINFIKFESLLKEKALFFCRADKFSDPFEGSVPKKEAAFRDSNSNKGIANIHKELKKFVVINCWQINNSESDAMWRIYLKTNDGVAIQTTQKRPTECFNNTNENVLLSKVRYIDYENNIWYNSIEYPHTNYNLNAPFIHKRLEYIHEKEYRVLYEIPNTNQRENFWENQKNDKGLLIPINVNTLIDKIILAPTADNKAKTKIENVLKKYNFNFQIENSKLNDEPIY